MKPYKSIYKESTVTIKENKIYYVDLHNLLDVHFNWRSLNLSDNQKQGIYELIYFISQSLKINKDNFWNDIRNYLSKKVIVKFSKSKRYTDSYDLKDFRNNRITSFTTNEMVIFETFSLLKDKDKRDTRKKLIIKNKSKFESDFYNQFNIFLDEIPDEIEWLDNKLVILKDTNYTKWINNYLREQ